jgi:hypothetical protein
VVIGIVVFGAMFWSMIVHRRSTGQVAAKFHESTTVEILWTVVPFLILVAMAVPATKTLINIYDASEPDIDIQVTGYQWKWHYKYLGQDVEFFSNLATPADQIHNKAPRASTTCWRSTSRWCCRLGQGAFPGDLRRRDPLLVGAGLRGQARRDPGVRQRSLDPHRQTRHLPRPVRRAVRQGPRLHADRGRGQEKADYTPGWASARPRPPSSRS